MLWFLDTLVTFPVSHADGGDGITVLVSLARRGDSPPYHVHHTEDEVFEITVCAAVGAALRSLDAGLRYLPGAVEPGR